MNESESNNENDNDDNNNKINNNENEDNDDYEIKQINDYFKMIDESISFELKYAFISNELDKMLFVEIFGHAFATLIDKLINTTNKEENRIIVEDIKKNMGKLYEHDGFYIYIIQSSSKRRDLIDGAKIIIKFNETIQLAGN